jgi:large subunit ribosomal protein L29
MKSIEELRQMADQELQEKEKQLQQETFNLRFQLATGRIENPMQIRKTRRELARVKTIRREKAIAEKKGKSQT